MPPRPLLLNDAIKQFHHDQEKMVPPEKTVSYFKKQMALSGLDILKEVVRVDNGNLGIPVYFSLCGTDALSAIGNVKQMGKGATPEQAQASAVMELAERFSLFDFLRRPDNFLVSPLNQLDQPALDFKWIAASLQDHSDEVPIVKKAFEELPLKWTWAHNLTRNEQVLIPFNWFWTINEFNGASAGNGIEEALCQGISEVVERHVCALTCRNKLKPPLIDENTIEDTVAIELIGKFRSAGIDLYLSDLTCEMGIPTIGALAWSPSTFPQKSEIVWTAGTTPTPPKALCRALTEVAQLAGDFNSGSNYVASGLPKFRQIEQADFITKPGKSTPLSSLPNLGHSNIKTEVERYISALSDRSLEVFTIDVRHPTFSIPAFYTIIPGTQFRERATNASIAMMYAKIVAETFPANIAVKQLEQFDRQLPNKYFTHFYLGRIHLDQGRYEDAEHCLSQALTLEPPDEDLTSIYTYLGLCHKEIGHYREAIRVLSIALRIDPERIDTLNLMGFCYFKLKAHLEAITCFEKAVGLDPTSAIDYANLAVNYRALDQKDKAVEFYQLALALDPELEFAREHLAQMGITAV